MQMADGCNVSAISHQPAGNSKDTISRVVTHCTVFEDGGQMRVKRMAFALPLDALRHARRSEAAAQRFRVGDRTHCFVTSPLCRQSLRGASLAWDSRA